MNKKFVGLSVAAALAVPSFTIMPAMADDDIFVADEAIVAESGPVPVEAVEIAGDEEAAPAEEAAEVAEVEEAAPAEPVEAEEVATNDSAASDVRQDDVITPSEAQQTIAGINETIATLQQIKNDEPGADWSKEFDKLFATASELTQTLAMVATNGYAKLAEPELVMARAHLIVEIGLTIDKSTDNLRYKIEKAHVELGFAVTRAILRVANIGATESQLNDSIQDLRNTYNTVSTYRDLKDTDRATIYVKNLLNKAIWNTRLQRDLNILTHKNFKTYNELNKHITKAVKVWFRAKANVADCDAAIADLNAAYAAAYAAPSVR